MTQDNKIRFICVIDHSQVTIAKEIVDKSALWEKMVDKSLFGRNIRKILLTELAYF